MFTVQLNKLVFFAYHGLHEEEAVIGNDFELNVSVKFDTKEKITSISQTINYASVYALIANHMKTPVPLLETLLQNITDAIRELDDRIAEIHIQIIKLHPPIKKFSGNVAVSYTKVF